MPPRFGRRHQQEASAGVLAMTMDDPRTAHVEAIHARISHEAYAVDAPAVAEALLRRLLEGRTLPPRRA